MMVKGDGRRGKVAMDLNPGRDCFSLCTMAVPSTVPPCAGQYPVQCPGVLVFVIQYAHPFTPWLLPNLEHIAQLGECPFLFPFLAPAPAPVPVHINHQDHHINDKQRVSKLPFFSSSSSSLTIPTRVTYIHACGYYIYTIILEQSSDLNRQKRGGKCQPKKNPKNKKRHLYASHAPDKQKNPCQERGEKKHG